MGDGRQILFALPKDLPGVPLVYVNSSGNRLNRGVFNTALLEEWGWKMASDAIATTNVTARALRSTLSELARTGETGLDGFDVKVLDSTNNVVGSPTSGPGFIGSPPGSPVIDDPPAKPCATGSKHGKSRYGESSANPLSWA